MLVYKGEGDGLIEVDIHEHDVPAEPLIPEDQLRPGNSMLTLETRDFDAILQGAVDAGFSATVPRVVASSPYDNRRVAALRGPVAERIELIEAHEPK